MKYWLVILCLAAIICIVQSDCPIAYYPEATFVGSITANIDFTPAKVKESQYTYNLVEPLTSNAPKVALMINSLSYRPEGAIVFNIFYKPTPSFSRLLFLVNITENGKNKWDSIKFSFFASQNKLFQLGSFYISAFTNTENQTRKLITSRLPLENTLDKPVLKVFLNGLSVISSIPKEQIDQIRAQIDGYRTLSWSSSIARFLERKLAQRQILHTKISNIALQNRTLSFFVDLGFKQTLEFISFSYVLFSSNQNAFKNEFIQGKFAFNSDSFINLPSLNYMDEFFIGIQSLKFRLFQPMYLSPVYMINGNKTFSFFNGFNETKNSFTMSYFAVSLSKENYCSHCRDGNIVYENFCISDCPQSYVKRFNGKVPYCDFCDIKQFKVLNLDKSQCICAMQYFSIAVEDTKEFTCSPCNYQCLTCESEYKCLTCDSMYLNTFRVFQTEKSQCVCSSGYYDDGQNNIKCLKCHESCLTCKGPTLFDCETCPKSRTRGIDGNCICENNFQEKNGACVCESPNFNYKNFCFTFSNKNKCSENEIQIIINGTQRCQCKQNYLQFRSVCILCNENQRVDNQTGKCVCKDGYYKDDTKNLCLQCSKDKVYNEELRKCVCMKGTFESTDGRCVRCKRRETLIEDECKCIYNYFKNDWGQCQKCEANSAKSQCQINIK